MSDVSGNEESPPPFVTKSGAISYVGKGYNPYSGKLNDFSKVTSQIPSNADTRTRAIVADTNPAAFQAATSSVNPNQFYLDALKILGGFASASASASGSGSSSSNKASKASDALARDKFNYDKQKDAASAAQAAQALASQQNYYDSGAANKGFDNLLKMIGDQGTVSENAVKSAYGNAITNLNQGYNAAQTLGTQGYDALNAYLEANQNNPYAGMNATVGSAPDALTQYLSAYGVSDQPVQGQIQADQLQAQQGAGNYQNLIDILSSVAQSGASSRGAESAMGQNLFNTTLGQERAGYQTKAEMAQADAMRQIQQIMYEQRMAQESARNAQLQQLAAALAAAGGSTASGGVAPVIPATTPATTSGYDLNNLITTHTPRPDMFASSSPVRSPEQTAFVEGRLTEDQARALEARRGY